MHESNCQWYLFDIDLNGKCHNVTSLEYFLQEYKKVSCTVRSREEEIRDRETVTWSGPGTIHQLITTDNRPLGLRYYCADHPRKTFTEHTSLFVDIGKNVFLAQ